MCGFSLNQELSAISHKIERQVQKRLAMKRGVRKKCEVFLGRFKKQICYRILVDSKIRIKKYEGSTPFGADEFGRDVADGISKYIELLKNRGLVVHTVIVLGSRVKGSWKLSSDIDITVISDNLPKRRESSLSKLFGVIGHDIVSDTPLCLGIEPSGCCSRKEFLRRLKEFDIQVLDAIFYGQIVYDTGFWSEVKREFQKLEREYDLSQLNLKQKLLKI